MPSRKTWRCREVSRVVSRLGSLVTRGSLGGFRGNNIRGTRGSLGNAPGDAHSVGHTGHVAYSQRSWGALSAWAFGTRGVLGRLPDMVSQLRHSGTCGSL